MTFYDEMQEVGTELLVEFDQGGLRLLRFESTVSGGRTWDPAVGGDPSLTVDLQGTVRSVEKQYIDGKRVLGKEKQVTFAVPSVTPLSTDWIEIAGRRRQIISGPHPIPGTGTPAAYKAVVGD